MGIDPDLGCRALYWAIALALALGQGGRAVLLQRDLVRRVNAERPRSSALRPLDAVFAYAVPDVILNFSCTIAGFGALAAIARILGLIADVSRIELGTGVFLSALLFVAVSGIAGILPFILSRTVYPGGKS